MSDAIAIAVIGCGRIGRMHAAHIHAHPQAKIAALYDIDDAAVQSLASTLKVPIAGSVDEIMNSSSVDAIIIASVTPTHADLIESAAQAGKPVFCEKPVDLDLQRVHRCAEVVHRYGAIVQMGFNRRFDPGHRAARQAVSAGDIGALHQVIITSRDPELPPKSYLTTAGGLLRDMTIHDFDLARYMLADEPVEVFATAGALIDPELGAEINEIDTAMIIMRTADGKQCHINNARNAVYGYDQRVELLGAQGMLISENRRPHELRRYSAQQVETAQPYLHFFIERYKEAFIAELSSFIHCVREKTEPEVSFEDGRRALILAEAAYRSLQTKRLVSLSEIDA